MVPFIALHRTLPVRLRPRPLVRCLRHHQRQLLHPHGRRFHLWRRPNRSHGHRHQEDTAGRDGLPAATVSKGFDV